jgi:hypothetical protein
MPNFARRENVGCQACHTTIPRVNRYGYQWRNAGFRAPDTIGQTAEVREFGDMNGARVQSQVVWNRARGASDAVTAHGSITFLELTLYPVTGAFGRWWSSEGEFSSSPEDFFEVENAYLRGTYGGQEWGHVQARAGVFHPFEGYGASDRPVTLARPLLQTTAANDRASGAGSTFFTPWGFDEPGIEVGYTYRAFNIAGTLFNGILVRDAQAFPFQGGNLSRANNDPNYNAKDWQIFANLFFLEDAAVSGYYYHGTLSVPIVGDGGVWTDNFDRLALYLTLPVLPKTLYAFAGGQIGWDKAFDRVTQTAAGNRFTSLGAFGEIFLRYNPYLGASARYDFFDPSRDTADNTIQAVTLAINAALLNGAQGILEYRFRHASTSATSSTDNNSVQLRIIYLF